MLNLTSKKREFLKNFRNLMRNRPCHHGQCGYTMSDIAKYMEMGQANASTYLRDLETMGYVTHDSGVAGSWRLTPAGIEISQQETSQQ